MREISNTPLWIGHAGDLREQRAIYAAEIQVVLDLADNEPAVALGRDLTSLRIPLSDDDANPLWRLELAIAAVSQCVTNQIRCLVCCSGGMSRSIAVAAAGLSRARQSSFEQALRLIVADGPRDLSPRLMQAVETHVRCESPGKA
jgi:protein-tyrosine phosphatase